MKVRIRFSRNQILNQFQKCATMGNIRHIILGGKIKKETVLFWKKNREQRPQPKHSWSNIGPKNIRVVVVKLKIFTSSL